MQIPIMIYRTPTQNKWDEASLKNHKKKCLATSQASAAVEINSSVFWVITGREEL
jgi:hypothetical protein